ncbi:hypothetical protein SELMODRAFT_437580 [Selaginella moellendorffii]|uniref:Uncharacterized protein n=1 Tax=Selaginella moellendorffii TaxID=88036 RepID=D8QN57_SELML|nr:hypothetical protein SELMODRAFT_437580 [Selaginella moellendorffii]
MVVAGTEGIWMRDALVPLKKRRRNAKPEEKYQTKQTRNRLQARRVLWRRFSRSEWQTTVFLPLVTDSLVSRRRANESELYESLSIHFSLITSGRRVRLGSPIPGFWLGLVVSIRSLFDSSQRQKQTGGDPSDIRVMR